MSPIASSHVDALELARAARALQRIDHAVGVVLDVGHRDPLGTRVAAGERVILVRAQLRQAAVLDRGDHAAQRLADAAEGDPLLDRHGRQSTPAHCGAARVTLRTLPLRVGERPDLQVYTRSLTPWQGLRRRTSNLSVRRTYL